MATKNKLVCEEKKRNFRIVLYSTISIMLLMAAYECAKHIVFPGITILQSHVVTVIFVTVLGACSTAFVVLKISKMTEKTVRRLEEIKKMEKAIISLSERLRFILENAVESLILFDLNANGAAIEFNTCSYESLGYSREEFESLDLDRFGRISEKLDFQALLKDADKLKRPLNIETIFRAKDGTIKHASATLALMETKDERYFLVAWKETTKTKRIEKILADNSAFFEKMIETIPMPVFYKNTHRHYLGCNKAFEDFFGVSRHLIVAKTILDLGISEDTAEKLDKKDIELIRNRGSQIYEASLPCKKKGMRKVVFHKSTFDDADGNVAGIVGIMIDLTEQLNSPVAFRPQVK